MPVERSHDFDLFPSDSECLAWAKAERPLIFNVYETRCGQPFIYRHVAELWPCLYRVKVIFHPKKSML